MPWQPMAINAKKDVSAFRFYPPQPAGPRRDEKILCSCVR